MAAKAKMPAGKRLLAEGFFTTEKEALPYFMAGKVYAGDRRVTSPGEKVPVDAPLTVRGKDAPYVGKGGLKLAGAIEDFGVSVEERVCIDAGACTGGFTHCLVKHGAALVYAVEVGFGQLAGSLQQNPHVRNMEKTNISDPSLLHLDPRPTLASVDLSYLSLVKAVPIFAEILGYQGEMLCLVKPLFEIDDPLARRTGRIENDQYVPLLHRLAGDIGALPGVTLSGVTNSRVTGNQGTREFFFHVVLGSGGGAGLPDLSPQIDVAVSRALALDTYIQGM